MGTTHQRFHTNVVSTPGRQQYFLPMTVMATIEIVQGHFGTVTMTIGTRFVEFIKTNHTGYPGTS